MSNPGRENLVVTMRTPPPEVIASWPQPNYIDPVTRGPALVIVNFILLGLSVIAVGARLWSRLIILRSPGLDDLLITIAIVSFPTRMLLQEADIVS